MKAAMLIALLKIVLLTLKHGGWTGAETGRFTAIDGDSLKRGAQEYRLHAIDAPELRQNCETANGVSYPCGRRAHEALRSLIGNRELSCSAIETDRYGRLVAICRAETTDIAGEMVRIGWAVAYRQHGIHYIGTEGEAKAQRLGLWQGRFQNPDEWRRERRKAIVRGSMAEEVEPD